MGIRRLTYHLQGSRIWVTRREVHENLKVLDAEGLQIQKSRKFVCRIFQRCRGRDELCSLDGHDKLKWWGFPLNGCNDVVIFDMALCRSRKLCSTICVIPLSCCNWRNLWKPSFPKLPHLLLVLLGYVVIFHHWWWIRSNRSHLHLCFLDRVQRLSHAIQQSV